MPLQLLSLLFIFSFSSHSISLLFLFYFPSTLTEGVDTKKKHLVPAEMWQWAITSSLPVLTSGKSLDAALGRILTQNVSLGELEPSLRGLIRGTASLGGEKSGGVATVVVSNFDTNQSMDLNARIRFTS